TYTNLYEPGTIIRATAPTGAPSVQTAYYYDPATGRVNRSPVTRASGTSYVANRKYDYDGAGNLTRLDDDPGTNRDTQCFTYDHQRRLTQAWTPSSSDCTQAPSSGAIGGPAGYWHSWSFGTPTDNTGRVGNRLAQTEHGTPSGDVTTTYAYPAAGSAHPHALTSHSRTDTN
ncbi:hypothetical protein, partial [Micromonospora echinofusca]